MTMTWWKVNKYRYDIEPVQIVKFSECFVTLAVTAESWVRRERREARADTYFPTFAEARTYLMNRLTKQAESLKADLEQNGKYFNKVFMMEEPK